MPSRDDRRNNTSRPRSTALTRSSPGRTRTYDKPVNRANLGHAEIPEISESYCILRD